MSPENKENKETGKARRILAWICLSMIAVLVVALITAAFTHAAKGTILALLFVLMAVPFLFYACITYLRHKEDYLRRLREKDD